ncbi:hypothetical protein ADIS_2107 [Lunatimonas lonarensis]|uniref:Uncharacterized protein n=1 Tax=Lunatimonas lonarensis TaxID=1232681 RepID=R7ZTI2_9BACT|nr:hypothetical protein ADIS_2107 [Lunatimonas lonarensis]
MSFSEYILNIMKKKEWVAPKMGLAMVEGGIPFSTGEDFMYVDIS